MTLLLVPLLLVLCASAVHSLKAVKVTSTVFVELEFGSLGSIAAERSNSCRLRVAMQEESNESDCVTVTKDKVIKVELNMPYRFEPARDSSAKAPVGIEMVCAFRKCPSESDLDQPSLGQSLYRGRYELELDEPAEDEEIALVAGNAAIEFTKMLLTAKGDRLDKITVESGEYLRVEALEDAPAYHVNEIVFEAGSRLLLLPHVDDNGDDNELVFTQLAANRVEFESDAAVLVKFPDEFRPDPADELTTTSVVALKSLELPPAGVRVTYDANDFIEARDDEFDVNGVNKEGIVSVGGDMLLTLDTELRFSAPSSAADSSDDAPGGSGGGGSTLGDNLVYIVGGGVGALLVCCVLVVTVCFVRKARREALRYTDDRPMASARDYGSTDGYLSAQHEPLGAGGSVSGAPDGYMTAGAGGGSISGAPRGSYGAGGGNYDAVPDERASSVGTQYALASSPGTMMLPPKIDEFEQSVYAHVPQAIRAASDPWELDFGELALGKMLGEGAYGTVHAAQYRGRKVAVKQMHSKMLKEKDIADFKKEARLMKSLTPHPNVVGLIGVNTDEANGPLFIVTEFCGGGACDSYLKKFGHLLSQTQRLSMMVAACRGVAHLHSQAIIHRDLACRNFLLTSEGGLVVADFGMSRDTNEDGNQTKCEVGPLRYMSPESMARRTYSRESDCWAFGVVMWEIESNAATPYGDKPLTMVAIGVAKEGLRLDQPDGCPDQLYALMHRCWQHDPDHRPTFDEIDAELLAIAQTQS